MSDARRRESCSLCRSKHLTTCMGLPSSPVANEFLKPWPKSEPQEQWPLDLVICGDCGHVQCDYIVDPKRLYGSYVYESGTSNTTLAHLRDEARTIDARLGLRLKEKCFVVEIGSNDGSFLSMFKEIGINPASLLGVDPADAMARKAGQTHGIRTLVTPFSLEVARSMSEIYVRPDVIVANNVLAHVPDVKDMLEGISHLLGDTGVLMLEVAHVVDLFQEGAWDTIYHEHMSHHALGPLIDALEAAGLPVFDAEHIPGQVGRGSLRVWASSEKAHVRTKQDDDRIKHILEMEGTIGVEEPRAWRNLEEQIAEEGKNLRRRMEALCLNKGLGINVWGYGAPAKLTTMTYAWGLADFFGLFDAFVDDSKFKQELLTPGTRIPITSIEELIEAMPDAVVVFAWNFFDDIEKKLADAGFSGHVYNVRELTRASRTCWGMTTSEEAHEKHERDPSNPDHLDALKEI